MKIVYVGDNRNRENYGCRATSTALSQLISQEHEIVGRVYGNYRNIDTKKIFYCPLFGKKVYSFLSRRRYWRYFRELFICIIHIIKRNRVSLSSFDVFSYDYEKNIKKIKKSMCVNEILKECDLTQYDFDALVINGEGSFIFSKVPWRESVVEATLMYWAKKMGKKVYFMNAMFSGKPGEKLNLTSVNKVKPIMESIECVCVREYQSLAFAKKYFPKANIQLFPDALFTWYEMINDGHMIKDGKYYMGFRGAYDQTFKEFDFDQKYVCVSASSSERIFEDIIKTKEVYCNLIKKIKEMTDYKVYIVHGCDGDDFLLDVAKVTNTSVVPIDTPILAAGKILANAELYITGRYHPAILASLGGTPCVFMGSNSHKTKSLQELLGYEDVIEYDVLPDENEIDKIILSGKHKLELGIELRNTIKSKANDLSEKSKKMANIL